MDDFDFPGRDRLDLIDLLRGVDPYRLRLREAAARHALIRQVPDLDGVHAAVAKHLPSAR